MRALPTDTEGFVLDDVLSDVQCSQLVEHTERLGFIDKRKGNFAGDRQRATFTDPDLAAVIWDKIAPYCRAHEHNHVAGNYDLTGPCNRVASGLYEPVGVNPFFRVSKYMPGNSFSPHTDTAYAKNDQYVGMHTLLLYLNSDVKGGETVVYSEERTRTPSGARVTPKGGRALVFYHYTVHEGAMVMGGVKYVVRTEVMFRRKQ